VGARDRYASAAAFRAALEHRLRLEAQGTGLTLQRLRKEAAYHRLLYRLQRAAPDSWAVKGGFALILRLGEQARATRDVDANWRATPASLEDALSIVEAMEDGDWFTFDIGDARPLHGEGEDGAYRYADGGTVTAAARETFQLRSTPWPPQLHEPPDDWAQPWQAYTAAHALRWANLDDAHTAVMHFWNPILDGAADSASVRWDPTRWRWTTGT
jgi:hypothetical protein